VRALTRKLRHSSAVRAVGLPAYRLGARLRPGPPPRVLANSLPKAGTHLLTQLLAALPDMRFSGEHLTLADARTRHREDWPALRRRLARVRTGQYASAHLPAAPEIVEMAGDLGYRAVFIVRDPRDVVVSDMFYILGFPEHPLHDALHRVPTPELRLEAMITGMPGTRAGLPLMEPLADRLDAYLGWLTAPDAVVVHFEDLVGPKGGGDEAAQLAAIDRVARHVDRPLDDAGLRRLADQVWSPRSSTFRKGAIGDWQTHFTDRHRDLVEHAAGAQLARLGYRSAPGEQDS